MSVLSLYSFLVKVSGLMYSGVPTLNSFPAFYVIYARDFAKPKSAILGTPSFNSILSGFKSR